MQVLALVFHMTIYLSLSLVLLESIDGDHDGNLDALINIGGGFAVWMDSE